MTMSFHTDACRWPDAPCLCEAEMFIVRVSSPRHETPLVVAVTLSRDEAEERTYACRSTGWDASCATEVVDIERAAELEARKAADERRLDLAA